MNSKTVAWTSDQEWAQVYKEAFYGTEEEKQHALDVLKVWRLRYGNKTPIAIEATNTLLEAFLFNKNSDFQRQQFLSAAVMQFVGLMTEQGMENIQAVGIRNAGERLGFPEWIIDLRHHIAHHAFPSLTVLEKAVIFCLDWLRVNHWDKQAEMNECCNLPLMTLIYNGTDDHHDIDSDLSRILSNIKQAQVSQNRMKVLDEIENVKSICKSHYEMQRLCVIFVLSGSYHFVLDSFECSDSSENINSLPDEILNLWKSVILFIAEHQQLPTLLYCLVSELCSTDNLFNKTNLVTWSSHIINLLNSMNINYKLNDSPIFNECLKLLLFNTDIYVTKVYTCLSKFLSKIFNNVKIQKLHELRQIFLQLPRISTKLSEKDLIYTLEDVLDKADLQKPKNKPNATWSLYNGKSLHRSPIGCLPMQYSNSLSRQLYNFSEWKMHTNVYDKHNNLEKSKLEDFEYMSNEIVFDYEVGDEHQFYESNKSSHYNQAVSNDDLEINQQKNVFENLTFNNCDSIETSLETF